MSGALELVCPAGTPAALHAAVDAGADAVYLGFRDQTNARNFPGLNFDRGELEEGLAYAHGAATKVFVAVNTYPEAGNPEPWHRALDDAARLGADAVILADIGLADHAARHYPELRRHLSVQAAACNAEAIRFYAEAFGIKRVVLPRVLTVDEIAALNRAIEVETEVFGFGGLCVMAEGRCSLSSYLTGRSPNMDGACSPASHVRYLEQDGKLISTLGGYTIDAFSRDQAAGYPTICKGRYLAAGRARHIFEEPASLNAMAMLQELKAAGVTALKLEGRQRGRAYVARVVRAFREAAEAVARGEPAPAAELLDLSEGGRETEGAYRKAWH
jgi:putative protease